MSRYNRKEIRLKNIIFESDNLIAMEKLLSQYRGKIDVMPIDPPYNTNIRGIGYQDYDTEWSDFMKQRLVLLTWKIM